MANRTNAVKVYVGSHLPNHINSTHIRDHFNAYAADITDAMVMRNTQTKQTLGFAVITFSSRKAAEHAIVNMDGTFLHGDIRLKVEEKHDRRHHAGHHPYTSHEHSTIFTVAIENVDCNALMECDLEELMKNMDIHFNRCHLESEIKSARVEFSSQADAERAVCELDGKTLLGQQVSASIVHHGDSSHSLGEMQSFTVKVSHIPPSVTKAALEKHFQQVGYVTGSKIHLTNNPYAHVQFKSHESATLAVERLNGSTIDGQVIGVKVYVRNEQGPQPHGRTGEQRSPLNDQGQSYRNMTQSFGHQGPPLRGQDNGQRSQPRSNRQWLTSEQVCSL